jgi:hypothetical protein
MPPDKRKAVEDQIAAMIKQRIEDDAMKKAARVTPPGMLGYPPRAKKTGPGPGRTKPALRTGVGKSKAASIATISAPRLPMTYRSPDSPALRIFAQCASRDTD